MEIIVEIHQGKDGRPTGTVRSAGETQGRSFSGNLEFLAVVEDLYLAQPNTPPSVSGHKPGRTDNNTEWREQ
jgi:hypothetical protein